jgi:hypothetical protein
VAYRPETIIISERFQIEGACVSINPPPLNLDHGGKSTQVTIIAVTRLSVGVQSRFYVTCPKKDEQARI